MLSRLAVLLFIATSLFARARMSGFVQQGNQTIQVLGYTSSTATPVQASYPGATVTVYNAGTGTKATLYSNNSGTSLGNPFTLGVAPETATNGYWFFYADDGAYDVQFSGTGIATPFTLFAMPLFDATAATVGTVTSFSGSGPSWLTWTVTNPTTTPAASLAPTTGQTPGLVIGTCGAATTFAPCALTASDLPSLSYCALTGCTLTGNLLFSLDNAHDIGASGATRPRDFFLGRNALIGGTLGVTGHTTFEGVTSTGATGTGNIVYSGSPTLTTPALGTPSAIVLTNATGCPLSTCTSGSLPAARGGTGGDSSSSTGIARDDAGTWSYHELSGDATTSGSNA